MEVVVVPFAAEIRRVRVQEESVDVVAKDLDTDQTCCATQGQNYNYLSQK